VERFESYFLVRVCTCILMYTASKALLLLLLLLYYGKPIIKQILKTPRWKRKKTFDDDEDEWVDNAVWYDYIYCNVDGGKRKYYQEKRNNNFIYRNRRVSHRDFLNNNPTRIFVAETVCRRDRNRNTTKT